MFVEEIFLLHRAVICICFRGKSIKLLLFCMMWRGVSVCGDLCLVAVASVGCGSVCRLAVASVGCGDWCRLAATCVDCGGLRWLAVVCVFDLLI
jgi:hypothetical protein